MPPVKPSSLRLWNNNPTATDLLGFDAVVSPILEALATPDLDPLTIGIHSPWGGGKSTVLRLLDDRLLEEGDSYLVISVDTWTFDDHLDVRGTLMSEILDVLLLSHDGVAGVKESVTDLKKRIGWGRIAATLGSGGITMQVDPDNLIKAFTPKDRKSTESMSGFREQFEELIGKFTNVERVVVLVDDLDRCLPEAVMATMEAIKLLLSVPKMVFVLAADQAMVRDAIAASLSKTSRSEAFADRYLEKIIRLPVVLPRLAPHDAEAYIALLLAGQHLPDGDEDAFDELVAHCSERRLAGNTTLLAAVDGLRWKPESEVLQLAGQQPAAAREQGGGPLDAFHPPGDVPQAERPPRRSQRASHRRQSVPVAHEGRDDGAGRRKQRGQRLARRRRRDDLLQQARRRLLRRRRPEPELRALRPVPRAPWHVYRSRPAGRHGVPRGPGHRLGAGRAHPTATERHRRRALRGLRRRRRGPD